MAASWTGRIAPDWAEALAPVAAQIDAMGELLDAQDAAGELVLPERERVFRAFEQPMAGVRVLIVGQDPYPTPGHAMGLAFSAEPHVRPIPRSLQNIFRELHDDLGAEPPPNGDLSPWSERGVMLLNRVLTVRAGAAASHRGLGWEAITEAAIRALVGRGAPLVAILWGRDAQAVRPALSETPRLESAHPSPLSASRGFFGSKPFSTANRLLVEAGATGVDWSLADQGAGPGRVW